jgi:hypothetical protein
MCDTNKTGIQITTEFFSITGCKLLSCCAKLPLYCKIDEIIIDKKYGFKIYFNTFFNQIIITLYLQFQIQKILLK